MIVAVKYCGGCNPRFNRSEIVRMINRDFSGAEIVYSAPEPVSADLLLIICGCSSRCISAAAMAADCEVFVLTEEEQYAALRERLRMMEGESK